MSQPFEAIKDNKNVSNKHTSQNNIYLIVVLMSVFFFIVDHQCKCLPYNIKTNFRK